MIIKYLIICDALKDNRIIVIAAIKNNPKALSFASERLKKELDY